MTYRQAAEAMRRDWIDRWYEVARLAARNLGTLTSDDLHTVITEEPPHSNWFGSLCARLKADGVIAEAGRVRSNRPSANGRKVTLWKAT